jgi:hypothetical protein
MEKPTKLKYKHHILLDTGVVCVHYHNSSEVKVYNDYREFALEHPKPAYQHSQFWIKVKSYLKSIGITRQTS